MVLATLWACSQTPTAPPPSVPAAPNAVPTDQTVPTLLGDVQGVAFVGEWTSAPCGGRTYARNIKFNSDQHYAVVDIVDPCPPGQECGWSGLTGFSGLWAVQGLKLRVQEIGGARASAGGPHPVLFEAAADGSLVENGCTYTPGLTVPPGYTEERVRPVIPP
ncbi:MAG: hypothetical protein EXR71_12810 [Myxococcales bacterium]|nr:hypothetical protein [Myxococcales bacterium]